LQAPVGRVSGQFVCIDCCTCIQDASRASMHACGVPTHLLFWLLCFGRCHSNLHQALCLSHVGSRLSPPTPFCLPLLPHPCRRTWQQQQPACVCLLLPCIGSACDSCEVMSISIATAPSATQFWGCGSVTYSVCMPVACVCVWFDQLLLSCSACCVAA
jgi:hypothetical protein